MTHALPADHAARLARARLSLLGLSVGDAFGECFFRPAARLGLPERATVAGPWRWTDDTAMSLSLVEVLEAHGAVEQDALAAAFARRYAAEPGRGYGAGAHSLLAALGDGADWREAARDLFSGQGSFGNGGAMRVAPVGAYFADDLPRAAEEARRSAEVTHAHPEGQAGAVAVAVAAALAWRDRGAPRAPGQVLADVVALTPAGATRDGLERAATFPADFSTASSAGLLGNGSRISAQDTVPFAVWCAARFAPDYAEALWQTASALGDVDTTCAIVGGIVALAAGAAGVPAAWVAAREPLE